MTPSDSSPGLLQDAMQQMEDELAGLLNEWAGVAERVIRAAAAVERLKAPKRLRLKHDPPFERPTKEDLDALVLDWLWTEHDDLMSQQVEAEALNAAYKTRYDVATKALSSKQTRLNADIRLNAVPR